MLRQLIVILALLALAGCPPPSAQTPAAPVTTESIAPVVTPWDAAEIVEVDDPGETSFLIEPIELESDIAWSDTAPIVDLYRSSSGQVLMTEGVRGRAYLLRPADGGDVLGWDHGIEISDDQGHVLYTHHGDGCPGHHYVETGTYTCGRR